ncbi:unnamed protein product [Adineta steineri]|uniref:Uncharacterized protein n=1 Tax=Adineta steineri TaxID=433720 RepID=A0A815LBZ3_9BILA|nr:unnamed protein product [Adineta steineri]CAF1616577.1 unnamed protein product [Adineta steineri]
MASIDNTTATNSTSTSTSTYPPTVQTGPVRAHDQPYALYGHWGITWLYQLSTDEYAWNDYIKRSMDFIEYGTFIITSNHEKMATWEDALASRTTLKATKSKSNKKQKKTSDPEFCRKIIAIAKRNPMAAIAIIEEEAPEEYYKDSAA